MRIFPHYRIQVLPLFIVQGHPAPFPSCSPLLYWSIGALAPGTNGWASLCRLQHNAWSKRYTRALLCSRKVAQYKSAIGKLKNKSIHHLYLLTL